MRAPSTLLAGIVGIASFWAVAARASAPGNQILTITDLTPSEAPAVLSACERLIWDRQTGKAVVEVTPAGAARLTAVVHAAALKEAGSSFESVVENRLPAYRLEGRGGVRFATKEPAFLVKAAGAPSLRPPFREGTVPEGTCLFEGFENLPVWYENGGNWWHYEGCSTQGCQAQNAVGDYFWIDDNCEAFSGTWQADAVLGGTYGQNLNCNATYDYNTNSWLEYAPWITCVAGVPQAALSFYAKVSSETNYDYFYYVVSTDGVNYSGYRLSGNYADTWYYFTQDMRHWTTLGDLTAYPQVALAFVFMSDNQVNSGFGVHLDNISLAATSLAAVASADRTSGTAPLTVHFAGAAVGGTAPFAFTWTFGDGSVPSTEQNPTHTYTDPGTYTVTLTVTDSAGGSATGGLTVTATQLMPPSVSSMTKAGNPFRFIVYGSNFQKGIKVYIGGTQWPNVSWKSSGKVVIKGGASLKATVPKGVQTTFMFENPDGTLTTYTWNW